MIDETASRSRPALRAALGALLAALFLSVLWNLPVEPGAIRLPELASLSLEVIVLCALLALLGPLRRGLPGALVRWGVALATSAVMLLKLAELVIRSSLARPLNPLLDVHLASSLVAMLTGTMGEAPGWLVLAGVGGALALVVLLSAFAVRVLQRSFDRGPAARRGALTACAVLAALWGGTQAVPFDGWQPVAARASASLAGEWQRTQHSLAEKDAFERAAASDPLRNLPADRLLSRLRDTDVLLVFFESYGRSALEQPRYAETILPTLDGFDRTLAAAGLAAASGYLTSPTVGGQSWLAHGALEGGLWVDNQQLYDLLVTRRDRLTLTRAFARAGHRTVAVKPAITMPWPEGELLGFEQVYASKDLGYAGLPYNWVTMPDQYTLSAFERFERPPGHAPLFAELSLISSHAPWTPVAPVLDDWDAIGDGRVFSRWAKAGDPPEVVWRDPKRVREQYRLAIDYVLRVLASYAARFVDGHTLLVIVGDHQPAPIVTGEGASRDVPMHVIARDPAFLEPFLAFGFAPGMRPDPGRPVDRMDAFRDFFLRAFSGPAAKPVAIGVPSRS